ncbi:hypothetical protein WA577_005885, partial [Blastocystis sp. JDR]
GLKTARGSGTNGFVQRNLSYIRPSRVLQFSQKQEQEIIEPKLKRQDKSILEHQARREIEVALLDLRDKMEEQGFEAEEIEKRVDAERKLRLEKLTENVKKMEEKEKKQREGEGEDLHDYGSEEAKKAWMAAGKREERRRSRSRSHRHHRHHSRSPSGSESRSRSRSRSESKKSDGRSRSRHHGHHHHSHRH